MRNDYDKVFISACLAGTPCRYDGSARTEPAAVALVQSGCAITGCPELLGGLVTPRPPAEIVSGTGEDVLSGRARVLTCFGQDVSSQFISGAEQTLRLCRMFGVQRAILKALSPSCGSSEIYDGTFTGRKCQGSGVTAALLEKNGIKVETLKTEGNYCG
ncbi:DUF523 domain-containing protein [Eubacteriales bacterium OttesenSCG-928-K08]|nr:DUF523 domain-containing protein [Eubacteriales bacterium OttesenSCG-928-K08]